jgi:hypothetical protein
MSKNIKSVLTIRRKQGLHIGASCLYGYSKDPERKGHLVVDPDAAEIVRRIFRLYAEGYGKTAIARILNTEGVPSPAEYKRHRGGSAISGRPGQALWRYYTISDMLNNEMYTGNMVQGKYGSVSYKTKQNRPLPKSRWIRVERTHDPIIGKELWERVQNRLALNSRSFAKDGKPGVFTGKVRCGECGCVMRSSATKGRKYLKCATAYAHKDACKGSFLSAGFLERAVLSRLNGFLAEYFDADYLERHVTISDPYGNSAAALQKEITAWKKRRDEYAKGIRELYLDKANGLISSEDFTEMSKDFLENRDRLDGLIAGRQESLASLEENLPGLDKAQTVGSFARVTELTRIMVEEWIDCVYVGHKDSESGERKIEISWNF